VICIYLLSSLFSIIKVQYDVFIQCFYVHFQLWWKLSWKNFQIHLWYCCVNNNVIELWSKIVVIKLSMVYVEWRVSVIHRRWWLDAIITCCRNVTCHFRSRCHVSGKSLVSVAHWCLQQQETSNSFMAFSRQVGWVGTRYSNKCSTNSHYGTLWTLLLGLIVVSIFSIFLWSTASDVFNCRHVTLFQQLPSILAYVCWSGPSCDTH